VKKFTALESRQEAMRNRAYTSARRNRQTGQIIPTGLLIRLLKNISVSSDYGLVRGREIMTYRIGERGECWVRGDNGRQINIHAREYEIVKQ
jgi:hypothetical protein